MMKALLFAVLTSFGIFVGQGCRAETLNMASVNYCPYQCDPSKTNGLPGYAKSVVRRIFEDAGYNVFYKIVPFGRALKEVEEGRFVAIPMAHSTSSKHLLLSSKRIASLRQTFYVQKDNLWRYQGTSSLDGVIVGSVVGYNYSVVDVAYQQYLENHKNNKDRVLELAGKGAAKNALRMIARGRLTTFNEDQGYFQFITQNMKEADRLVAAGELGRIAVHFAASPTRKDAKELLKIFDVGIERLRESGELTSILARYNLKDWIE